MYNNGKDIKVSEHSIEIAYKRYLADSAPGFILIAIVIYRFHSYIEMSFDPQTKIFFYFLLFLLSTPLGLAVNAVGYLFLDKIVHLLERVWVFILFNIFLTAAEDEFLCDKFKCFFLRCMNDWDWISVTRHVVRIMDIYHHDRYHAHEHESGAHIFLRNVTFIILFIYILHKWHILQIEYFNSINVEVVGVVILFLLFCSAYVSYYYHLAMLCDAYILCCRSNTKWKTVSDFTECLIQESKNLNKSINLSYMLY